MSRRQPAWKRAWDWLLGRDERSRNKATDPDRTVEAAWLPAWQAQMVADTLVEADIPAVVSEDFSINLTMYTREPMARIFVTEDRRDDAETIIEEILGHPPRHRGL